MGQFSNSQELEYCHIRIFDPIYNSIANKGKWRKILNVRDKFSLEKNVQLNAVFHVRNIRSFPTDLYLNTENSIYSLKKYTVTTEGCEVMEPVNIQLLFFTHTNVGSYFTHSSPNSFFLT